MNKLEDIRGCGPREKKEATEDLATAARSLVDPQSNVYMVDNNGAIIAHYCGDGADCTGQKSRKS